MAAISAFVCVLYGPPAINRNSYFPVGFDPGSHDIGRACPPANVHMVENGSTVRYYLQIIVNCKNVAALLLGHVWVTVTEPSYAVQ